MEYTFYQREILALDFLLVKVTVGGLAIKTSISTRES